MGMAASQARYIELTARKSNVEYEGQQINQQRTALSNESGGMFSQLMTLKVPTPPSTDNYTTTQYTFNDGSNDCTIDSVKTLTGDPNYNSTVSYSYNLPVYTAVAKTRTDLGAKSATDASGTTWWLTNGASSGATNQTKLTQCATTDTNITAEQKALAAIAAKYPTSNLATDYAAGISNIWQYTGTNGTTQYYSKTDLAAMPTTGAASALAGYYASDIDTKQNVTEKAYVQTSASGRYSTVQLASETGTTLDLTASTTTNQVAYNNAMNEYEYQQNVYAKQVEDINAKTEVIQEEDRTLEMKLRQLDTEQQALSTEMDSVKKVIDKNIESTFKTFAS